MSAPIAGASGNLIWYNRSVQVGGGVWGAELEKWSICSAVVFTAYDKDGNVVAREARPDDGKYNCRPVREGFGFMLDADTVYGGIRKVRVDLWAYADYGSTKQLRDSKEYTRP